MLADAAADPFSLNPSSREFYRVPLRIASVRPLSILLCLWNLVVYTVSTLIEIELCGSRFSFNTHVELSPCKDFLVQKDAAGNTSGSEK